MLLVAGKKGKDLPLVEERPVVYEEMEVDDEEQPDDNKFDPDVCAFYFNSNLSEFYRMLCFSERFVRNGKLLRRISLMAKRKNTEEDWSM